MKYLYKQKIVALFFVSIFLFTSCNQPFRGENKKEDSPIIPTDQTKSKEVETQLIEVDREINNLASQRDNIQTQIDNLNKQIAQDKNQEMDSLKTNLKVKERQKEVLESQISNLKVKKASLEEQINTIQEGFSQALERILRKRNQIDHYRYNGKSFSQLTLEEKIEAYLDFISKNEASL